MKKMKLLSRIIHMHSKASQLLFVAKRKMENKEQAAQMVGFLLACRLIVKVWYEIYGDTVKSKEPERPGDAINALLN